MACYKLLIFLYAVSLVWSKRGPLPRATARPVNVDPDLDCAIKELAWEHAKQLLPRQGVFKSAYDALELGSCNTSLSAGKQYERRPFLYQPQVEAAAVQIYVDAVNGDDSNPGTIDKPVRTLLQAVSLYRLKSGAEGVQGIIYLREGTHFLTETINLGPEDSNLIITGYSNEKATISGGEMYRFAWKEMVNKIGPLQAGINSIYDAGVSPGESNGKAKFYGKVDSATDCQKACEMDGSCFAFTWHDTTLGSFANMCYFRIDGLWAPHSEPGHTSGKKLYILVADLTDQVTTSFTSLFIDGRRAVRARYPDGNPETMGLHTNPTGYVPLAVRWLPPAPKPAATEVHVDYPERNGTHFPQFQIGIGGPVDAFDPPESYWGTKDPTGGGGATYKIPTGLWYLPSEGFANRTWKRPETGVVHAFHCGHWGNWQFAINGRNDSLHQISWSYGGFQEARGCESGAEWYVENILEELDAPGEWYFDNLDNKLYFFPNGSVPQSGIGTVLDTLINIEGGMDSPVQNITIANLTFAHTATTFLKHYEVPSGGDWAIHRGGAVFVEGVDGFLLQNCLFDAPGGNGLFLSNYIRNAIVDSNEFVYCGDSAIAVVGSTKLIDGTDGNQPRGTKIIGNLIHEVGIFGKQTSAYFQSLACETEILGNVFFNGPRAGINFNDGFGGGNFVGENLGFNMVRETGDHGPFNSWDRQPYLTNVKDGTPSLNPAPSNLTMNFLINNYHSTWPIDHDDGSCYYIDRYNYLVYGGYKNYLGHTKIVKSNYYIYPDASHSLESKPQAFFSKPFCANSDGSSNTVLPSGWGEVWVNNTCIIGNPNVYDFGSCNPNQSLTGIVPLTANNTFYAPNHYIYIKCGEGNFSLAEYQKLGYDIGSQVFDPVDTDTIISWGRKLFGL